MGANERDEQIREPIDAWKEEMQGDLQENTDNIEDVEKSDVAKAVQAETSEEIENAVADEAAEVEETVSDTEDSEESTGTVSEAEYIENEQGNEGKESDADSNDSEEMLSGEEELTVEAETAAAAEEESPVLEEDSNGALEEENDNDMPEATDGLTGNIIKDGEEILEAIQDRIDERVENVKEIREDIQGRIDERVDDVKELKNEVHEARNNKSFALKLNSLKFKLIGGFLLPVVLIIILGVISYRNASSAIVSSFEESAQSAIDKTADYYELLFSTIVTTTKDLATNSDTQKYYSKVFMTDQSAEGKAYDTAKAYATSITLNNNFVNQIYILGNYGKDIYTASAGSNSNNAYENFKNTDTAAYVDENRTGWFSYNEYFDKWNFEYSFTYIRQLIATSSKPCGYVIVDLDKDTIYEPLMGLNFGDGSIFTLVASDGGEITKVINSDEEETIDSITMIRSNSEEERIFANAEFYQEIMADTENTSGSKYVTYNGESMLFLYSKIDNGYTVCALVPRDVIMAQANSIKFMTVIMVIIGIILASVTGIVMATGIDTTLNIIMKNLEKAATGDLTVNIRVRRKDEFKVLTDNINNMIKRVRSLINEALYVSEEVSASTEEVTSNTQLLLDATQAITDSIKFMEQGIMQQANDSEDCMRQMDNLSDKIAVVSENTNVIAQIADDAKDTVKNGLITIEELDGKAKDTVNITSEVIAGIESLQGASKKIGNIIGAINEIAEQTNLLSLNASIEAARAGEAGRGFAVVADEIRKLADQSVASVNEIELIIADINTKTKNTVNIAMHAEEIVSSQGEALQRTIKVFNDIEVQVDRLADNLANIVRGVGEIEETKQGTVLAVESISAVSQETAATAEEITESANKQLESVEVLNGAANELCENSEKLIEAIKLFNV